MPFHDPHHTSRATVPGPRAGKIAWKLSLPGFVQTKVLLVSGDGRITVLVDDDFKYFLWSISPSGEVLWKRSVPIDSSGDPNYGSARAILLDDGSIVFGSPEGLHRLSADGEHSEIMRQSSKAPIHILPVSWGLVVVEPSDVQSADPKDPVPAVLLAHGWDGDKVWQREFSDLIPSPVETEGGQIAVLSATTTWKSKFEWYADKVGPASLQFVGPKGQFASDHPSSDFRFLAADIDRGRLYEVGRHEQSTLVSRALDGSVKWTQPVQNIRDIAVSPSGNVVLQRENPLADFHDAITAISADGQQVWSFSGDGLTGGIAIDSEGWVYHSSSKVLTENGITALRPDGSEAWRVSTTEWSGAADDIVIGAKGRLYYHVWHVEPPGHPEEPQSWLVAVADE